ncbi:kinase-like protein [Obba rivulosa]|uniref:Kinase-like protein n=1 Tax=Obba rivulosa TaxID=1052685 RepID=A0A8E2DP01_9APHY|nr:kinase-like protein [Obba rivulosa]
MFFCSFRLISSIAVRNWIRGEHIGRGTTGSDVYLALNAVTGEMMAIRQVRILDDCDESSQNNSAIRALRWEHDVLKDLDHQNLVQGLGYTEKAGVCTLFLEYVAGGSLQTCIDKYGRINEEVTKSFAREILSALEYLHSKGIIHTHLKSSNILLEPYGRCKVSDFGNCIRDNGTSADRRLSSAPGSIFWMAPEARNSSDWRSPMDIWSFGCIVLEMWTGRKPWGGVDASSVPMTDPLASEEVTLSPLAEDFRQSCFAKDPSHRATAAQLRQHGYLEAQPDWTFTGFK